MAKRRNSRHPNARGGRSSSPQSREKLKKKADEAFDKKQCAFDYWHAARKDRNATRTELNRCKSQLSAVEKKLKEEQRAKDVSIRNIERKLEQKRAELQECKHQSTVLFREASRLRKHGDRDAIFAKWQGYDLNDLCHTLEAEIQALEAELDWTRTQVSPSFGERMRLRNLQHELSDQLMQAVEACAALEEEFRQADEAFREAQRLWHESFSM